MYAELHKEIIQRLPNDFDFKRQNDHFFQQGICPNCGKREFYTHKQNPWILRCGRLNKCGHELHIRDMYPDLFESWSDRFPSSHNSVTGELSNTSAAADAYMKLGRGFSLEKVQAWYTQGSYYCGQKKMGTATVKFQLNNGSFWERFIDKPDRFGKMKANFVGSYSGYWWQAPTFNEQSLAQEIWLTEGIFDAIALLEVGITAVSVMSCHNFPSHSLKELISKLPSQTKPKLVFAFDVGKAGESFAHKFVIRAKELGWDAMAALPPSNARKLDWNELLQRGALTEQMLEECRYRGKLLLASNAMTKALLMHESTSLNEFPFEFEHSLFWYKFSATKYNKHLTAFESKLIKANSADCKQRRQDEAIREASEIQELAKSFPQALYFQENKLTNESWYYFRIDFPHNSPSVKNTFSGNQLSSGTEFKKRLLSVAPGAVFNGQTHQLNRLLTQQLFNIKRVHSIDFIGYSKEFKCYVFNNIAVQNGRLFQLNDEDFFDLGKLSIKAMQSIELDINSDLHQIEQQWITHLWQAFGEKGIVALAFWFGSLFAEQIRFEHKSYPFLEIVGEPGTGKSTLLEFLWKLVGRLDYEGFDPSKSTIVGRSRNFVQVANLPVVLIEGDRGNGKDPKQKGFDWDELKTAYNGRSVRTKGIQNGGNDTSEPPFRGAIVIAQNANVQASDAILQRIVHLKTDRVGHTTETKAAADWLGRVNIDNVSGFLLQSVLKEKDILNCIKSKTKWHEQRLSAEPQVCNIRIVLNHAQICALVEALALVIDLTTEQVSKTHQALTTMAVQRQQAINADHPYIEEFWEVFEFIECDREPILNHSRDPNLIAINLNQLAEQASDRKQRIAPLGDLKRLLKTSRSHKFLGQKSVNSAVNAIYNQSKPLKPKPLTVKCWVFAKNGVDGTND